MKHIVKIFLLIFLFSLVSISNTNSEFVDTENLTQNTFTAGCWAGPDSPILSSPSDTQLLNHLNVSFSWQPSSSSCNSQSLQYQIQIASDNLFNTIIYTSNWLTQTSFNHQFLSDGTYFWRVIAKDSDQNQSSPSPVRSLAVDTQIPQSVITYPWNSDHDNDIKYTYLWDGLVKGTSQDNYSGIDHIEISIQRMILDVFWDGSQWVKDQNTRINVGVSGPDNHWEYQFRNRPPIGIFKIVSHAVDKAGNIENSATIIFENTDVLPQMHNLSVNRPDHTITLDIANAVNLPLNYEITYTNQNGPQGFFGTVNTSSFSKTFYFGTCSGSDCLPDSVEIGSTITVLLGEEASTYLY